MNHDVHFLHKVMLYQVGTGNGGTLKESSLMTVQKGCLQSSGKRH